jgi:hypothetical protein
LPYSSPDLSFEVRKDFSFHYSNFPLSKQDGRIGTGVETSGFQKDVSGLLQGRRFGAMDARQTENRPRKGGAYL